MLFIYGTLRHGARNRQRIEKHTASFVPASVRGALYKSGKYPFLLKTGDTKIVGELTELLDEKETFKWLDEFEGPEYRREEVEVTTEKEETKKAWAYLFCKDSPPMGAEKIESGDWIAYSS